MERKVRTILHYQPQLATNCKAMSEGGGSVNSGGSCVSVRFAEEVGHMPGAIALVGWPDPQASYQQPNFGDGHPRRALWLGLSRCVHSHTCQKL